MKQVHHKHYELGTAPYRFVGIWSAPSKALQEANPSAYNNAMTGRPKACRFSCDHCGTGIEHHCLIVDANGERFAVGSSCIAKLHDTELLEAVEIAKRKAAKVKRKAIADQKRANKQAAYEAELEAQRAKNDGLTDWELQQKERAKALEAKRDAVAVIAEPILTSLRNAGGDFCADISCQILDGHFPSNRAATIVIEIIAKQSGRKGSKAYNAAYPAAEQLFKSIAEQLQ